MNMFDHVKGSRHPMKASPFRVTESFLKQAASKEILSEIHLQGGNWWEDPELLDRALSEWKRNPSDLKMADHIWYLQTEAVQGKIPPNTQYVTPRENFEQQELIPALKSTVTPAWNAAFDDVDAEVGAQTLGPTGHLFAWVADELLRGWNQQVTCEVRRVSEHGKPPGDLWYHLFCVFEVSPQRQVDKAGPVLTKALLDTMKPAGIVPGDTQATPGHDRYFARVTVDLGDKPSQWAKSISKFIRALGALPRELRSTLGKAL